MDVSLFSAFRTWVILFLIATILTGCAVLPGMSVDNSNTANSAAPNPVQPIIVPVTPDVIAGLSKDLHPYQYYVGPGDKISIIVWGHPEFSSHGATSTLKGQSDSGMGDYLIEGDGTIFFPLLGNIPIAGMSSAQIAALFTEKLSVYVKNPQVTVRIDQFASQQIYLMGEIGGGGTTAAVTSIPVTSTPTTLAFALAQGGGINVITADTRLVYVVRGDSSMTTPTVYWFDARSPASMIYAQNFPLKNNDVVFVSPASITRVNRVLGQLLPTVQTIWFTKTLVDNP